MVSADGYLLNIKGLRSGLEPKKLDQDIPGLKYIISIDSLSDITGA